MLGGGGGGAAVVFATTLLEGSGVDCSTVKLLVRLLVESGDAVEETEGLPTTNAAALLELPPAPAALVVAFMVVGIWGDEDELLLACFELLLSFDEELLLLMLASTDKAADVTEVDDTGFRFKSLSAEVGETKGKFVEEEAVAVSEGTEVHGVARLMDSTFTL